MLPGSVVASSLASDQRIGDARVNPVVVQIVQDEGRSLADRLLRDKQLGHGDCRRFLDQPDARLELQPTNCLDTDAAPMTALVRIDRGMPGATNSASRGNDP